jgi:hypothetical protein
MPFTPPSSPYNLQKGVDVATAIAGDVTGFSAAHFVVADVDPSASSLLRIKPANITVNQTTGAPSGTAPAASESSTIGGGSGHEDQWVIFTSPGTGNPLDKVLAGHFDPGTAIAVNGGYSGNIAYYATKQFWLRRSADGQSGIRIDLPSFGGGNDVVIGVQLAGVFTIRKTSSHSITSVNAEMRWRMGAKVDGTTVYVYADNLDDDAQSWSDTYTLSPGDPTEGEIHFPQQTNDNNYYTAMQIWTKEAIAAFEQAQGTIAEASRSFTEAALGSFAVVVPEPTGAASVPAPVVTRLHSILGPYDNEASTGAIDLSGPITFTAGLATVNITGQARGSQKYLKVVSTADNGTKARSTAFGTNIPLLQGGAVGFIGDSLYQSTRGVNRATAFLAHLNKTAPRTDYFTRSVTSFPGGGSSDIWDNRVAIATALNADSVVGIVLNNGFNDFAASLTVAASVAWNVSLEAYFRANVPTLQWVVHQPVLSRREYFPPGLPSNTLFNTWALARYPLLLALDNPANKTFVGDQSGYYSLLNRSDFYSADGDHFTDAGATWVGDAEGASVAGRIVAAIAGFSAPTGGGSGGSGGFRPSISFGL